MADFEIGASFSFNPVDAGSKAGDASLNSSGTKIAGTWLGAGSCA